MQEGNKCYFKSMARSGELGWRGWEAVGLTEKARLEQSPAGAEGVCLLGNAEKTFQRSVG